MHVPIRKTVRQTKHLLKSILLSLSSSLIEVLDSIHDHRLSQTSNPTFALQSVDWPCESKSETNPWLWKPPTTDDHYGCILLHPKGATRIVGSHRTSLVNCSLVSNKKSSGECILELSCFTVWVRLVNSWYMEFRSTTETSKIITAPQTWIWSNLSIPIEYNTLNASFEMHVEIGCVVNGFCIDYKYINPIMYDWLWRELVMYDSLYYVSYWLFILFYPCVPRFWTKMKLSKSKSPSQGIDFINSRKVAGSEFSLT